VTDGRSRPRFEVFHGEAHPAEARVYVRAVGEQLHGAELTGTVHGPISRRARTLPSRFTLRDLGMDPGTAPRHSRLGEAILLDAAYWLPQLPNVYEVEVRLRLGCGTDIHEKRLLGICPLASRGRDLVLAGRRWVLRGSRCTAEYVTDEAVWHGFRDTSTAIVVDQPDDVLCERASREGVLLVASLVTLRDSWSTCARELDRLARWPAVRFAILPVDVPEEDLGLQRFGNMILAQRVPAGRAARPAPWARVLLCEGTDVDGLVQCAGGGSVPVVAFRPAAQPESPRSVRAGCDRLQRDLAPLVDLAGYVT
jgi:hypothetical protein